MTFLKAIAALDHDRDLWIRQVAWKGCHIAFTAGVPNAESDALYRVPAFDGGRPAFMPTISELLGQWEVVSAEDVNEGR